MKFINIMILCFVLLLQSSMCYSKNSTNIITLPDPFMCHQYGLEYAFTNKSTLGILGRDKCKSDRPAYGSSNADVSNTFSRVSIPWRYSRAGSLQDGYFLQTLIGTEKHEFTSVSGSTANVVFTDVALYVGRQWFWTNGLNVSALLGTAVLIKNGSDKNIVLSENSDVIEFLDKNTKSNIHAGFGVILGWSF